MIRPFKKPCPGMGMGTLYARILTRMGPFPPPVGHPSRFPGPHCRLGLYSYVHTGERVLTQGNCQSHGAFLPGALTCPVILLRSMYIHRSSRDSDKPPAFGLEGGKVQGEGAQGACLSYLRFLSWTPCLSDFLGGHPRSLGVGSTNRDSRRVQLRSWSRSFASSPPVG